MAVFLLNSAQEFVLLVKDILKIFLKIIFLIFQEI